MTRRGTRVSSSLRLVGSVLLLAATSVPLAATTASAGAAATTRAGSDTIYLMQLNAPTISYAGCAFGSICPSTEPLATETSGAFAKMVGVRATAGLFGGGQATVRAVSTDFTYNGANGVDTTNLRLSTDIEADGPGIGTIKYRFNVAPPGGGEPAAATEGEFLPTGVRKPVIDVPINAAALVRGQQYRATVTLEAAIPANAVGNFRFSAPLLIAGSPSTPAATKLVVAKPKIRLNGRKVKASVSCPTNAKVSCAARVKIAGKGVKAASSKVTIKPGQIRVVTVNLSKSQLKKVRRLRNFKLTARLNDTSGASGSRTTTFWIRSETLSYKVSKELSVARASCAPRKPFRRCPRA